MTALNLYTARVGDVGSFFVAAIDISQARAIAERWKSEQGIAPSSFVAIKRFTDSRIVYAPEV